MFRRAPPKSAERANPGAAGGFARHRPEDDDTDYEHRHFVNLVSAAFLLTVAIGIVWTVKALDAYETQRACFDSGRTECIQLEPTRHYGILPAAR